MLTTTRRDKRNRRQASLTLECLDERLVLSAAAAGAAAGAVMTHHEARLAQHRGAVTKRGWPAGPPPTRCRRPRLRSRSAATLRPRRSASTSPRRLGCLFSAPSSPVVTATPVSSGATTPSITTSTPAPTPVSQSSTGTLSANVAAPLQSLYNEYEAAGSGTFKPSQPTDKPAPDQRQQRRGQHQGRFGHRLRHGALAAPDRRDAGQHLVRDLRPGRRHAADLRTAVRGRSSPRA